MQLKLKVELLMARKKGTLEDIKFTILICAINFLVYFKRQFNERCAKTGIRVQVLYSKSTGHLKFNQLQTIGAYRVP